MPAGRRCAFPPGPPSANCWSACARPGSMPTRPTWNSCPRCAAEVAVLVKVLAQAPHRVMFFVGASNVLLAMAWWAMWLLDMRWQLFGLRQPQAWAGWLHAFVMQYQVLPSFFFGFLLTV